MLRVFLASDFDGPHQPFKGDLDQAALSAVRKRLQAALDNYPEKGGKIEYERVTGVRKAPGTKKQKPKRK
jgi:hypothetical protein